MLRADNLTLEVVQPGAMTATGWAILGGTLPGYLTFASRMADGDTFHYLLRGVDVVARPTGEWEIGRGMFRANSGTPAVSREKVYASSNGTTGVAFSAGIKHLSIAQIAPTTDEIRFEQQALMGLDIAGQVGYFATTAPPDGWLKANGAAVSRTAYSRLFARIGTTYGVGDGSTTFNLPDGRGEFLRGWDDGRSLDTGRAIGSVQMGANFAHSHGINDAGHAHGVYDPGHAHGAWTDTQGYHAHTLDHHNSGAEAGNYGLAVGANFSDRPIVLGGGYGFSTGAGGAHGHNIGMNGAGTGIGIYGGGTGITIRADGGAEGRPRNLALLLCIKY